MQHQSDCFPGFVSPHQLFPATTQKRCFPLFVVHEIRHSRLSDDWFFRVLLGGLNDAWFVFQAAELLVSRMHESRAFWMVRLLYRRTMWVRDNG